MDIKMVVIIPSTNPNRCSLCFSDYYLSKGLNRFDMIRQSIISTTSSNSDSWDAYSMISSPNLLHPTNKHMAQFSSLSSLKSFSMGDNSSVLEESYTEGYHDDSLDYIDTESDSDGISINVLTRKREPDNDEININVHTRKCESDSLSESCIGATSKAFNGYSDMIKNRSVPNIVINGADDEVFEEASKDSNKLLDSIKSAGRFSNSVGGNMPYEVLKSSIPDIVTFHAESRQMVYINDADECTKL